MCVPPWCCNRSYRRRAPDEPRVWRETSVAGYLRTTGSTLKSRDYAGENGGSVDRAARSPFCSSSMWQPEFSVEVGNCSSGRSFLSETPSRILDIRNLPSQCRHGEKNNWSLLSYLTWHANLVDFCFDEHSNIKAFTDQICFVSFSRQVETFPYHAFLIALQCLKVT